MGPSWADRVCISAFLTSFLTVVPEEERLQTQRSFPAFKHENVPKQTHTCGLLALLKLEDVLGNNLDFYMIFHNGPCPVRSQVC